MYEEIQLPLIFFIQKQILFLEFLISDFEWFICTF
jgi:hypothetical protein